MSRIVVGVDGSDESLAALAWAVEEARLRGAELHVVHVYQPAVSGGQHAIPALASPVEIEALVAWEQREAEEITRLQRQQAETVVNRALQDVGASAVDIHRVVVASRHPARIFVDLSKDDEVEQVVLGTRGGGGFGGLRIGSVANQCMGHAVCPVTLVPRDTSRD